MPDINGTTSDDILIGTGSADVIRGFEGNDTITGGGGNDVLIGGTGNGDVAVFSGNRSDYLITTGTPFAVVTDLITTNGDDGSDQLFNVEFLQFADLRVSLGIDPNNAPRLGQPAMIDQVWDDSIGSSYQIPATSLFDLDANDVLTFVATLANGDPLPVWLSFNGSTRTFSGTPPISAISTSFDVRVTATDPGQLSVSDVVAFSVTQALGADIVGTAGDDQLSGTFRSETMIGLAGNDYFIGSPGADKIDGGASSPNDTVSYENSPSRVVVNLATGAASGGYAEGDLLLSIESVVGSAFSDDITGTDGGDVLNGGAGMDLINGGKGDDIINGGLDNDTIFAGAGNDIVYSRALFSGDLEDIIDGGGGAIPGQFGLDTLNLSQSPNAANISLAGGGLNPTGFENAVGSDFHDVIAGNDLENLIFGGLGNDILSGAGGADTLHGEAGNDTLRGGSGSDSLYGEEGDDRLDGGAGADILYGGDGNDTVDYRTSPAGVSASLVLSSGFGGDAEGDIYAFNTLENIDGSEFDDSLAGNEFANKLSGFGGNDVLSGGAGDDVLDGGAGIDTVSYASSVFGVTVHLDNLTAQNTIQQGIDTIRGFENILGSGADDVLFGDNNNNVITAGGGFDTLVSGGGTNTLIGGTGGDIYFVQGVNDIVTEGVGGGYDIVLSQVNFSLAAGSEVEALAVNTTAGISLTGNEFGQNLTGNAGNDTLNGGGGNDLIISGGGTNTLIGGTGADIYYAQGLNDVVTEDAGGGFDVVLAAGNLTLAAGSEVEVIAVDTASGVTIIGSDIVQTILGGAGNDRLIGGRGNDTLVGSGGADTFVLLNTFADRDFITDFASGSDKLEISAALFGGGLGAGVLSASQFFAGAGAISATTAAQRFIYNSTTGNLLFDADGNGAGGAILFANLSNIPTLTAADFLIAA